MMLTDLPDLFPFLLYSYGDSVVNSEGKRVHWRVVQRCAEVAQTRCDLSNETWDLDQGYFARVRAEYRQASSRWVMTRRFDPKSDSKNQRETVLALQLAPFL